jgi:hypothetical protein
MNELPASTIPLFNIMSTFLGTNAVSRIAYKEKYLKLLSHPALNRMSLRKESIRVQFLTAPILSRKI